MSVALHSRTGKLDKPSSCHDPVRASFLNRMASPPKNEMELMLSSSSLLVLFRLGAAPSGWLAKEKIIGEKFGVASSEDVAALIVRGLVMERTKGVEITDDGNALLRALVSFSKGWGVMS